MPLTLSQLLLGRKHSIMTPAGRDGLERVHKGMAENGHINRTLNARHCTGGKKRRRVLRLGKKGSDQDHDISTQGITLDLVTDIQSAKFCIHDDDIRGFRQLCQDFLACARLGNGTSQEACDIP